MEARARAASRRVASWTPRERARAGLGGIHHPSRVGTYLSMTTAGVWLAIVANWGLLRAAGLGVSAQQMQQQGALSGARRGVRAGSGLVVLIESRQQWSVEVPRLRPARSSWPQSASERSIQELRLCAKKGGMPRSTTEAENDGCADLACPGQQPLSTSQHSITNPQVGHD